MLFAAGGLQDAVTTAGLPAQPEAANIADLHAVSSPGACKLPCGSHGWIEEIEVESGVPDGQLC